MPEPTASSTPAATPAASPSAPEAAPAPPAGAAPAEGASAAPPVTPPEPEKPKAPEIAPRLGKVARREAELRERAQTLEAQQKEIEEIRKKFEADQAELSRLRAIKGNPVAVACELGMTPQQFLEAAAKGEGFNTDPAMAQAIAEMKSKTEALEKAQAEQKKREEEFRQQQIAAQYHGRIESLMEKGGDRWAFAKAEGVTPQYILDAAREHVKVHRVQIASASDENRVIETVLDNLETHLTNKFKRVAETPVWAQRFKKAEPTPPAGPPPPPAKGAPTPTLSNSLASQTPPETHKPKPRPSRETDLALTKQKFATLLAQHAKAPAPEGKKP